MFVGHYSVAFACRTEQNRIPVWVLFVAVQFLDYIWATLVLLGIEKLRVIKGFTEGSMLDSYFHPYLHSLITAILWSAVAALVYKGVCGRHPFDSAQGRLSHDSKSAPLIIGLAVFSHWILDLIAHPRDLPIYDNRAKVGFGLWNYGDPEFALADRRHLRSAHATHGQAHSHGRLDFLHAICSYCLRRGKGRLPETNQYAVIVIIFGVSGAGKTTVGELLARKLCWCFIEADDFHPAANVEKMRSGHPLTDEERWPWLERLREQIKQSVAVGENAVLACSALKRAYRDRLRVNEEVRFVFLRGNYALVKKQLRSRHDHFMNPELLQSQFDDLEEPQPDKHALTIGLRHTPQEIVEEIQAKLHLVKNR